MKLSASQAAKETGKSIPTITRAIKSGKLSAEKQEGGGFLIDPSELFRVFPAITSNSNVTPSTLGIETPSETRVLEVEVQMLRERLAEKDGIIDDLRTDRDHWRDQAERATRLLAPPVGPERPRRAWWQFGRSND